MKWDVPHVASIVFWIVWILSLFFPRFGFASLFINALGGLILLVHVAEIFIFWKRIDGTDEPVPNAVRVLLFGIFHARTLPEPQSRPEA